jgi:hypothetical protein
MRLGFKIFRNFIPKISNRKKFSSFLHFYSFLKFFTVTVRKFIFGLSLIEEFVLSVSSPKNQPFEKIDFH